MAPTTPAPIAARRLHGGRLAHAVKAGAAHALCGEPRHACARWREDGAAAGGLVTCRECLRQLARKAGR